MVKDYYPGTDYFYINIIINDLKLQYYYNNKHYYRKSVVEVFRKYDNIINEFNQVPFSEIDLKSKHFCKVKYIEINNSLKALLNSEHDINRILAKSIMFSKLGINEYE